MFCLRLCSCLMMLHCVSVYRMLAVDSPCAGEGIFQLFHIHLLTENKYKDSHINCLGADRACV